MGGAAVALFPFSSCMTPPTNPQSRRTPGTPFLTPPPRPQAPRTSAGADTFVKKTCETCHNPPKGAARLDLTNLAWEPANPDNFAVWIKVHDRVSASEMPPAGIPRPASDSITQFVKG